MQKRKFIILIATLVIIIFVTFVVFLFTAPKTNTTGGGVGSTITNFITNFLPFGNNKAGTPTNDQTTDISNGNVTDAQLPQENLMKISSMPVAGFGVFLKERFKDVPVVIPTATENPSQPPLVSGGESQNPPAKGDTGGLKKKPVVIKPTAPPTEFVPAVRYVEKATGNIYQTFADKIDERKFTNTVIPKVQEAFFGSKGESVIIRYLKEGGNTIETFVGTLPKEILGADTAESTNVIGKFLPENITDLSISADTLKIFYLFNYKTSSVGITALTNGDKRIQIFNSPFTEWLSFWPKENMVTITTKPSSLVAGFMYAIDPTTKTYNKVLGDINGLTTLPGPDGNLVLYAGSDMMLHLYNTSMHTSDSAGVKTLPEKCTWNKTGTYIYCAVPKEVFGDNYPDTWYQGEVSFSDEIWRIDTANLNATIIADLPNMKGGEEIDGIKLAVDENEGYLFFVNKKDSYLWELRLK